MTISFIMPRRERTYSTRWTAVGRYYGGGGRTPFRRLARRWSSATHQTPRRRGRLAFRVRDMLTEGADAPPSRRLVRLPENDWFGEAAAAPVGDRRRLNAQGSAPIARHHGARSSRLSSQMHGDHSRPGSNVCLCSAWTYTDHVCQAVAPALPEAPAPPSPPSQRRRLSRMRRIALALACATSHPVHP